LDGVPVGVVVVEDVVLPQATPKRAARMTPG
jgi:hypothetical protein